MFHELQTELLFEPRYPMFGGWKSSFTIGYGLPLQDYLFELDGNRFLNITFGCPINEVVVDNLIVKVSNALTYWISDLFEFSYYMLTVKTKIYVGFKKLTWYSWNAGCFT